MNSILEQEIHQTDLTFTRTCYEKYGINRGVFNVIDSWFYERGYTHILKRRKIILQFLRYLHDSASSAPRQTMKFGSGGVSARLSEFWLKHGQSERC